MYLLPLVIKCQYTPKIRLCDTFMWTCWESNPGLTKLPHTRKYLL